MDLHRLSAAGGALALHGLALAAALTLAVGPPALRRVEPVQVALIAPPEPLPLAAPAPRAVPEPPRAEPPRAEPPAPKPPPRPVRAAPRPPPPAPPPAAAPEPPRETVSIPPPAAAPAAPAPAAPAATAPTQPDAPSIAAAASSAATAPSAPLASARSTRSDAPGVPAGPTRLAPRVDATWSGNTPPPYPPMARRMGDEGEVRLDVRVGADGRVTDIRLKQSSGSALLDRTAIDTVRKWRFKPATVDGQPVAEWYHDWRWVFRLEG